MLLLGEFRFEPESGELRRDGELRRLEPQPAKVLALLALRAGEVVSHEELAAHVWGAETHVDFERGLRYCVAQIRAALGDSAQSSRFIETLPKRGYRLIVPASSASPVLGVNVPEVAPISSRPRALGLRWVGAVALLLPLVVLFWLALRPGAPPAVAVAVVPFDNETGQVAEDRLARGFSDSLVARLAAIEPGRLAVVGNASALFTPRERRDLQALGQELEVGYVILGQVQRAEGGQLRVIAHLIRVSDQKHLWAHRFEPAESETSFEARVADTVAAAVRDTLLEAGPKTR